MLQICTTRKLTRLDVRYSQKIILAAICELLAEQDTNELSQQQIADAAGCHLATVKRNVKFLKMMGKLHIERDERGQKYSYEVLK